MLAVCAGSGGDKRGFAYMLAPQHLGVGDAVHAGPAAPIRPGSSLPLRDIPDGQQARPRLLLWPATAGSGHPHLLDACAQGGREPEMLPEKLHI